MQVGLAQDSGVLMLEHGNRRFVFDESIECIDSPADWRLIAPGFLAVRVENSVFVNQLRQSCPAVGDSGRFTNNFGESIRGEKHCRGDNFTQSIGGSDLPIDCRMGLFWPVSIDIGASGPR